MLTIHFRNTFKKTAMFRQALKVYLPSDMESDFKLETLKLRMLSTNFIRNMIILNHGEEVAADLVRKLPQSLTNYRAVQILSLIHI